ncbi:zinc-ribbon domain-containing protein [Granulicoccus sp. GXG6511]|uniref:zinc-ribbon domain-containing protein n=1 Tax=Granulicoccus sp. GXG6511 TaxID=3381351 RepID=UPI003D7C385A
MLLIFGTKGYREILGVLTLVCRYCGHPAAHRLEKVTDKFTLFFIPLFTVSTRFGMQCAMCGAESRLDREEAEQLTGSLQSRQHLR